MKIVSVASAIPEHSSSNGEIETRLGLAPGWIERRTGILRRPTAAPEEATSDLAIRAASAAVRNSEIDGRDIGLVLLATSTPDPLLPPTAPLVAHRLGGGLLRFHLCPRSGQSLGRCCRKGRTYNRSERPHSSCESK